MVLETVLSKIEKQEQLRDLFLKTDLDSLALILQVLQQGSTELKIASARVLETIANDAKSKLIKAEKENLLEELLKLISPKNESSVIEAGLSYLIRISMLKRARLKLVQLGAIKSVAKLISDPNPSSTMSIIEKSLKVMETMSLSKEGWSQICNDVACVAAIV
ncbi:hypothetical protein SO802_004598 [Lithocarpus litseifolius]|uniref:U-box domain-containing protein n=1 Tax=Lithocarpus litseifolius TaxID=425828 RepID=A0AAW2E7G0_9ROSI